MNAVVPPARRDAQFFERREFGLEIGGNDIGGRIEGAGQRRRRKGNELATNRVTCHRRRVVVYAEVAALVVYSADQAGTERLEFVGVERLGIVVDPIQLRGDAGIDLRLGSKRMP